MEQAGLLPDPAKGQATDSDAVLIIKSMIAAGGYYPSLSGTTVYHYNNGRQVGKP